MKHMFNTLVQPHTDYCSQLWMPQEGRRLEQVEKVMRDLTRKIPVLWELSYPERLSNMLLHGYAENGI